MNAIALDYKLEIYVMIARLDGTMRAKRKATIRCISKEQASALGKAICTIPGFSTWSKPLKDKR